MFENSGTSQVPVCTHLSNKAPDKNSIDQLQHGSGSQAGTSAGVPRRKFRGCTVDAFTRFTWLHNLGELSDSDTLRRQLSKDSVSGCAVVAFRNHSKDLSETRYVHSVSFLVILRFLLRGQLAKCT